VRQLCAAIAFRAPRCAFDPHQECVQVLGLYEAVAAGGAGTLLTIPNGCEHFLLEIVFETIGPARRE